MEDVIEVRWHGRGGQGAKTAALLLADVGFNIGKHIQGFPEYGAERMGAPIIAYTRISNNPIRIHSNIYNPDYAVIVDDTLMDVKGVLEGIKPTGAIIINSVKPKEELLKKLEHFEGSVYKIDAKTISVEALGQYFPNMPMLSAIVKIANIMEDDKFVETMQIELKEKFKSKPEVIEGNIVAIKNALNAIEKVK